MTGRLVLQALDALVKGEAAVARAQQARPPLETHALDAANAQLGPPVAGRLGAPSGDGRARGALGSQEEAGLMGGSHRLAAGRPRLFNREDGPAGRIARRAWAMVTAEYDVGRPLARELAARVLAAAVNADASLRELEAARRMREHGKGRGAPPSRRSDGWRSARASTKPRTRWRRGARPERARCRRPRGVPAGGAR